MGNIPVVQEASTDTTKAKERVDDYFEQSVAGTVEKVGGNDDEAKKFYKGCGRATGRAICGGGLMENVPVFQELSTAGKSSGEVIAGDPENIEKHVDAYVENSVAREREEDVQGNKERGNEFLKNSGKAVISAAVSGRAIAVTVITGGAAAPLGVAASTVVEGAVGTSVILQGTNDILYNDGKLSSGGDYVRSALEGGALGAVGGALMANANQQQQTATLDAKRMQKHKDLLKDFKEKGHDKFTSTTIHDKTGGKSSHGFNRAFRNKFEDGKDVNGKPLYKEPNAKIKQSPKKSEYANTEGSLSYPKGYPNVKEAYENPKVQAKLNKIGRERWDVKNCAEPHALETLKANNPKAKVDASYTLEVKNGREYIKAPCNNCNAMGEVKAYGRVPFKKYDGMPVDDAIKKHVDNANAVTFRAKEDAGMVNTLKCITMEPSVTMELGDHGGSGGAGSGGGGGSGGVGSDGGGSAGGGGGSGSAGFGGGGASGSAGFGAGAGGSGSAGGGGSGSAGGGGSGSAGGGGSGSAGGGGSDSAGGVVVLLVVMVAVVPLVLMVPLVLKHRCYVFRKTTQYFCGT